MLRYTSDNIGERIEFKTLYVGANVVKFFIFHFYKNEITSGKPRLSTHSGSRKYLERQMLLT